MTERTQEPSPASGRGDVRPGGRAATRAGLSTLWSTIGVTVVVITLAVGVYALYRSDSWGDRSAETPDRFQLELNAQMEIPAELLGYVERRRFDLSLTAPKAIAVVSSGTVYVAGDSSIEIIGSTGPPSSVSLKTPATCLAVSVEGSAHATRLYVGAARRVVVLGEAGEVLQQWPEVSDQSVYTSIAVAGDSVFVADAGQRVVLRFSRDGQLLGTIGKADPSRQMPGFVIPSPYFDLAVDEHEVVHVVNPGMRRVESYNFAGELQSYWGRAGSGLPDFFGCCNPAHLTLLPDGRYVTSEKGIPRIKIYSQGGDMQCVVAGPRQLGVEAAELGDARGNQHTRVFDVSVDSAGNVFVLDTEHRQVIVYEPRAKGAESES